jgi:hypothetical protein
MYFYCSKQNTFQIAGLWGCSNEDGWLGGMFWICVATMRYAHFLVGKPVGKTPLDKRGTACTRNSWTYVRTRPGDGPSVSSWQVAQEHSVPWLNEKTGNDETLTLSCIPWGVIEFSTSIFVPQTASFSVIGLTQKVCEKWSAVHDKKAYKDSRNTAAPRIPNLSIRWTWLVSFTAQPLYPRRQNPGTH